MACVVRQPATRWPWVSSVVFGRGNSLLLSVLGLVINQRGGGGGLVNQGGGAAVTRNQKALRCTSVKPHPVCPWKPHG